MELVEQQHHLREHSCTLLSTISNLAPDAVPPSCRDVVFSTDVNTPVDLSKQKRNEVLINST